ncbi:hypothetical protein V6N13_092393 [Hibiscus sabdariffa]|uniref:Uncharacterized protein n=1 Tax=Hibiscus sabdariffa TaxID=183260 RepID=A0ABR2CCQ4_9ROSI
MNVSSRLFTSAPVHVVLGLAKQPGSHDQPGQTCTDQVNSDRACVNEVDSTQECAGSMEVKQADSVQQKSGQANYDHFESLPAFEVQIDEECAEIEHNSSASIERNDVYVEEGEVGSSVQVEEQSSTLESVVHSQGNTHSMMTRSKRGIFKPKVYLPSCDEVPRSVHEAMKSSDWRHDVMEEMQLC